MKIYFVRHGETEWNVKKKIQGKTDIPLNENGRNQAKKLAEKLVKENFYAVKVYSSPQLRALQTAQTVADALQIPCEIIDGFAEMDLGEWEGLNWKTIHKEYGDIYHYWNTNRRYVSTPGGECYNDVLRRTLEGLAYILERETEDVLVVTHSAILMSLRCYLARRPFDEDEMVGRYKTKNAEVVSIEADSIREALKRFRAGE